MFMSKSSKSTNSVEFFCFRPYYILMKNPFSLVITRLLMKLLLNWIPLERNHTRIALWSCNFFVIISPYGPLTCRYLFRCSSWATYIYIFFLFNWCIDLRLFGFRMMVLMKLKKQPQKQMNSSKQIQLPIRIELLLLYKLMNEGRRCLLPISLGSEILGIHVCWVLESWAVLVCPSIFKCFTNYCLFYWGHWSFIIWNWKFKIPFFLVRILALFVSVVNTCYNLGCPFKKNRDITSRVTFLILYLITWEQNNVV